MTENTIDTFWGDIFSKNWNDAYHSKIRLLRNIPLFAGLTKKELNEVSKIIYDRKYEEGEFLFEKEQPGAALFIIRKGKVDIVIPQRGDEFLQLASLSEGSSVGELALLDDSPRSASARAAVPTEASAFFRTDLQKLLETHPLIGSKIYRALSYQIGARLKATNEQLQKARNGRGEESA